MIVLHRRLRPRKNLKRRSEGPPGSNLIPGTTVLTSDRWDGGRDSARTSHGVRRHVAPMHSLVDVEDCRGNTKCFEPVTLCGEFVCDAHDSLQYL